MFLSTCVIYVQRHRNNESRRNRNVQPSPRRSEIPHRASFPLFPRVSSVSSYKAKVHISGPSTVAAALLGLTQNSSPSNFAPSLSFCLPFSYFQTFLENCVRKCVSGMMHGDRDQKERKEKGGLVGERSGGGGGPRGHAGDEGEELVMVMRRCNDSSAVCSIASS